MGAHEAAVERDASVVGVLDQALEDALSPARFGPAGDALAQGLPLLVALGQVTPVGARSPHP